ncbi:MAG TPA: glycosyltransferase family 4 protein [Candidatus Acidoferrales bacterium]|nr:glycosyltransferase family 4 protein [Candidatus Acidoferrales bacterium]
MTILYLVAERTHPATSGSRIRASGIAAALETLGPVVTAALDEIDREDAWGAMCRRMVGRRANLATRVLDRLRSMALGSPALLERALGAGAAAAFDGLLERHQPTLIVLSRPYFGPFIGLARLRGATVIVDADESLVRAMASVARSRASLYRRVQATLDGLAARRFEAREYRRVDQLWVSSPVERAHFGRLLPIERVREVPNLAPGSAQADADTPEVRDVRSVAFVGIYTYAPNEEAATELMTSIMPAIRAAGGPRTLVLVGRDPTTAMRRAADRTGDVTITGTVDDPVRYLRDSGVLVVPIRAGAGSRVKILEAMRAGIPVVTTARGLEGLGASEGVEVLVADTPAEFAAAVLRLRDDAELRGQIVESARAFVRERHSQAAVTAAVRAAVGELAASPPA